MHWLLPRRDCLRRGQRWSTCSLSPKAPLLPLVSRASRAALTRVFWFAVKGGGAGSAVKVCSSAGVNAVAITALAAQPAYSEGARRLCVHETWRDFWIFLVYVKFLGCKSNKATQLNRIKDSNRQSNHISNFECSIHQRYSTLRILTPQSSGYFEDPQQHPCYTGSFTPSIGGSLEILRVQVSLVIKLFFEKSTKKSGNKINCQVIQSDLFIPQLEVT